MNKPDGYEPVMAQTRNRQWSQTLHKIEEQIRYHAWGQLADQVLHQLSQTLEQVRNQVSDQVWSLADE